MVHIVRVTVTRPRGRPRLFRRILSLMAIIMLGLAGVLAFGLPRAFGLALDPHQVGSGLHGPALPDPREAAATAG